MQKYKRHSNGDSFLETQQVAQTNSQQEIRGTSAGNDKGGNGGLGRRTKQS